MPRAGFLRPLRGDDPQDSGSSPRLFAEKRRKFRSLIAAAILIGGTMGAQAQGPGAPPRPPRDEQASFVLADPELTIELVASEPQVASPVAIAWDEEGRLFVAEMLDYPTAATAGRIRMLEDRDGDGRYEHA
ncbi:MAG: DUF7133 domain-containing protein, partial [Isosphaeraceae bacterium]